MPYIAARELLDGSEEQHFYHQLTTTTYISDRQTPLGEGFRALGNVVKTKHLDDPNHRTALEAITRNTNLGIFNWLVKGSSTFHSAQHMQAQKRNNYTVSYNWHDKQHIGKILYFVTNFQAVFAVMALFIGQQQSIFPTDDITGCTVPHISVYTAKSDNIVHIVDVSSLRLHINEV